MTNTPIAVAARCLLLLVATLTAARAQAPAPPAFFAVDQLGETQGYVCAMAFDGAGRLYLAEQPGVIEQMVPNGNGGFGPPTTFANLQGEVSGGGEVGLLGMTLAPDFATTRELYLVYTTAIGSLTTRVARIRADATFTTMEPGSLVPLLDLPGSGGFHIGGEIRFPPGEPGVIMFATGDNGRSALARDLDQYEGKMLRIGRSNGLGLPDNPFFDGNPASFRSRVWAYGFRNPFQWQFYTAGGNPLVVYNSENGISTDRFSRFVRASDGAWAGSDAAFVAPPDPNHRVLATSPASVTGIAISPSGPFGTNVAYIARYNGGIRRLQLGGATLDNATLLDGGNFFPGERAIDLAFGPDGSLYLGGANSPSTIRRVRYLDAPPVVVIATTPADPVGNAPLTVQFSDQSTSEAPIASRRWRFGDGTESVDANPVHQFARGEFDVSLTLTTIVGTSATATRRVRSIGPVALHLSGRILDARDATPVPLAAATDLRFYAADGITPVRIVGGTGAGQNTLFPVPSTVSVDVTAFLSSSDITIGAGAVQGDGVYEGLRGFRFAPGAGSASLAGDFCLSDEMFIVRAQDVDGNPAVVDVGLHLWSSNAPVPVGCGRDYVGGSGPAPTGVAHRVVTDELGWANLPLASANTTYRLEAPGDTGVGAYMPLEATRFLQSVSVVRVPLAFARYDAGHDCDNLAPLPQRFVDFDLEVQPLFDRACTGCHGAGTPAAQLDLRPGASRAALLGVTSTQLPGVQRVEAGNPQRSYLLEKVNCAVPRVGARMPAPALTLGEQALLRDWIRNPDGGLFLDGFE